MGDRLAPWLGRCAVTGHTGLVTRGIAYLALIVATTACGVDPSAVAEPSKDAATGGVFGDCGGGFPSGGSSSGGVAGVSATGGVAGSGGIASGGSSGSAGAPAGGSGGISVTCVHDAPCSFPQGVPDEQFIATAQSYQDTDPAVDAAVNSVMQSLTGCGVSSDCDIVGFAGTTTDEICQSWFAAVTQALRDQGFCAGQHSVGSTDEIAVSNTCCEDKWYGYHICNYGGPKVVWNPGARRGWWMIEPSYCGP
jgi:hypothetical protein